MQVERRPDSSRISNTSRRPPYVMAAALVVAALIACGDPYLHTNPYDPVYPVVGTITGPDTLFSLGEVGHYSVQINPAWPDSGVIWAVDTFSDYFTTQQSLALNPCIRVAVRGDTALVPTAPGAYESILPPLEPYSFKIAIEVWLGTIDTTVAIDAGRCFGPNGTIGIPSPRHVVYKEVVVTQRLTSIRLRCPDTHACTPLTVGDTADIWVDGFDALGGGIKGLFASVNPATGNPDIPYVTTDTAILRVQKGNNPIATYVSRDSTIARATPVGIRVAHITAVNPGSTWIVATRGALADSLQVVVH